MKLFLESSNQIFSNVMFVIILFKSISLVLGAVPSDWRDIHHAVSVLHECSSLHWDVEIGNVSKSEVDESLEVVLAKVVLEAHLAELNSVLHGQQTVLWEAIFKFIDQVLADLLSNLHDVGTGDNTDVDSLGLDSLEGIDHVLLDS